MVCISSASMVIPLSQPGSSVNGARGKKRHGRKSHEVAVSESGKSESIQEERHKIGEEVETNRRLA